MSNSGVFQTEDNADVHWCYLSSVMLLLHSSDGAKTNDIILEDL